jgi:hypothetical protein
MIPASGNDRNRKETANFPVISDNFQRISHRKRTGNLSGTWKQYSVWKSPNCNLAIP